MSKFHISRDGVARPCKAKGACPLGGDEVHFNTREEAQEHSDNMNGEEFGLLSMTKEVSNLQERMSKVEKAVLPKLDEDFNKPKLTKEEKARQKSILKNPPSKDVFKENTSMGEYIEKISSNPDSDVYVDNKSWPDMEKKYYEIVDNDFIKNGEKYYDDREYLKDLHLRAQKEAFKAGLRYKAGVDPSSVRPEGMYRAFKNQEEYDKHYAAEDERNKKRKESESAQNEMAKAREKVLKYKKYRPLTKLIMFPSNIINRRRANEAEEVYDTARESLYKANDYIGELKEKRRTDPVTAMISNSARNGSQTREFTQTFNILGERHGLHTLGVEKKINNRLNV